MKERKITVTAGELRKIYAKVTELIKEKKLFTAEVNLALARNHTELEKQLKPVDATAYDLLEKYAAKKENGELEVKNGRYLFETDEKQKKYMEQAEELEKTEIEITVFKVESEKVVDGKHDEPTAFDLVAMDFMLEF